MIATHTVHAPGAVLARRHQCVLFVDVVDSLRLSELDEESFHRRWWAIVGDARSTKLPRFRGTFVKSTGDGMLLLFQSALDAITFAFDLQEHVEGVEQAIPAERKIHVRVGIHSTDIIDEDIDIGGTGVSLASRLTGLADAGQVVISAAIRDSLADGLDLRLQDIGERTLKGVARPVRAFFAWPPNASLPLPSASRLVAGQRASIAVIPFHNRTGSQDGEWLGDMLADDLITTLSRLTHLAVISRLSTTPFRGRDYEPRNVAEVLGVRYVIAGDIHASGTRIRLHASLIESSTGQVAWSEKFDGTTADLFDLQDRAVADISKIVVPLVHQLEFRRVRQLPVEHLNAYEKTIRAIDHMHRTSLEDLRHAQALLESAVAADGEYVAARAWLAHLHLRLVSQGWSESPDRDADLSRRLAESAVERDDTDAWAISVSGLVAAYLDKDLESAIVRYDKALTINPSSTFAWLWSTSAHAWLENRGEAVARSPRAMELSPLDPGMYSFTSIAGTAHCVAGEYDKAIDMCRLSLRHNRLYTSTHRILTIALALAGKTDEARSAARALLEVEPGLTVGGFLRRYPGNQSPHAAEFGRALREAGLPP